LHIGTPSALPRLDVGALGALPVDVERPTYERAALGAAIVHLGIGAFARAHLAAVNEAALHATGDLRWGIVGVSLRHVDTRDALAPQDGLYTLALRDADAAGTPRERLRIIGALRELRVAPEAPSAVLERIAAAETCIVSLTVTEKGYSHDPASGALRFDDPDIAHDLLTPAAPRSAIGFIVHGLQLRRQRGHPPLTLLACDNLPSNGRTLRGLVLAFAARLDAGLHDWIENECTFPNSMVDRIVPRTTADDRTRIEARLGCVDAWPVVAEPFLDWVIEDRFVAGRPLWEHGGARFVADAAPFERMKLRMLNGSHSALAYLGATAGFTTVDAAVGLPALRAFVDAMMRLEIAPTLAADRLDLQRYRMRLLERFANPALRHRTLQIAMDGSQKLPQRILDTVRDRLTSGDSIERLALVIAAWICFLGGVDEAGRPHAIEDPLRDTLAALLADADRRSAPGFGKSEAERHRIACICALGPVFGTLGSDPRFIDAVARQSTRLREGGVRSALAAFD